MIPKVALLKRKIVSELEVILAQEDYSHTSLEKYSESYNEAHRNYSKLCNICLELEKSEVPFDCLTKPFYCVKYEHDFLIIKMYEDIKMHMRWNYNYRQPWLEEICGFSVVETSSSRRMFYLADSTRFAMSQTSHSQRPLCAILTNRNNHKWTYMIRLKKL